MFKYIIIIIVLIVIFIGLYIVNKYQVIKDLETNITVCQNKIMEELDKKKDYLQRLANDSKDKDLMILLNDVKDDVFEKENTLFDIRWKLDTLVNNNEYNPENENETYYLRLKEIEEDIEGLKDYYNSKVIIFNELYENKIFKPIYKLLKLEHKKQFKLRKLDSFEILKD